MTAVQHLVLFRWQPTTSQTQRDAIANALRDLRHTIPGILSLSYGKQNSQEPAAQRHAFEYGYHVLFSNRAARDAYLTHPQHLAAVELLLPHLADVAIVDYDLAVDDTST